MRAVRFSRLLFITYFLLLPLANGYASPAVPADEASKLLPDAVGELRALNTSTKLDRGMFELVTPEDFAVTSRAVRNYVAPNGEKFGIDLIKTRSDSAAYALFLNLASRYPAVKLEGVGTKAFTLPSGLLFFKGPTVAAIYYLDKRSGDTEPAASFARRFAETLDKGDNDIPALVKHLPEFEKSQENALYAVSLPALQKAMGGRPILDAISFEGGAEAVTANYGPSRLVIVENTTPQLATTQDARINARLKELREAGQPVPTVYRRVGNYSVFVFDAPDEATATKLVDAIKYEQVVQWLGDNPNDLKRAQRRYTETTAGVIIAVLKASGLSLLLCLGIGALFGGIVFKRRRQQQAAREAFSDAGGMVRLNLDEMTSQYPSGKLLGPGKQS